MQRRGARGGRGMGTRSSERAHRAFLSADLMVLEAVLKKEEVAELLGVGEAEIARWSGGSLPKPGMLHRVRVAAGIVRDLCTTYEPEVVAGWLAAPRLGALRSPADLLRDGRYDELGEEVRASLAGEMS